jgi:hypothetical protein
MDLQVYPNPVEDMLFVAWDEQTTYEINIFNVLGELMYQGKERQISTALWPSGIYIVNVNQLNKKIIVK